MSLFKSLLGAAAPIIGGIFGGPVGATIGGAIGGAIASPKAPAPQSFAPYGGFSLPSLPSIPGAGVMQTMGTLPAIAGTTVRAGIAGARVIISSARYYCARYPGWCLSIGGLGVVEGLVREGKLPLHRRRRGKGISARDFKGFGRVHRILSGFCAPRMRVKRRALGAR
jgi:hypothetical protein